MDKKFIALMVVLSVFTGISAFKDVSVNLELPEFKAGAVSGPSIDSSFLSVNGNVTEYRGQVMRQATTTVCALRAPVNATSTLKDGNVHFTVSSTTASTVTVAKATTPFATTTLLRTVSVGANGQSSFPIASTTASASVTAFALAQTDETFAPGEYIVVSMAGGTGTFSPTGTCQAEFLSVAR